MLVTKEFILLKKDNKNKKMNEKLI